MFIFKQLAIRRYLPIRLMTSGNKDIPNVDFVCQPLDNCWCKDLSFKMPIPKVGMCYSPREMDELKSQFKVPTQPEERQADTKDDFENKFNDLCELIKIEARSK